MDKGQHTPPQVEHMFLYCSKYNLFVTDNQADNDG